MAYGSGGGSSSSSSSSSSGSTEKSRSGSTTNSVSTTDKAKAISFLPEILKDIRDQNEKQKTKTRRMTYKDLVDKY